MARSNEYPIIRFLAGACSFLAVLCLVGGLVSGSYLWIRGEALRDGMELTGPFSESLYQLNASQLGLGGGLMAGLGFVAFLLLGALGQFLTMQRDRTLNSDIQVRLLEDILEINEEAQDTHETIRVSLCDGCRRLGSLHKIESGQWICRECRRQIRTAS